MSGARVTQLIGAKVSGGYDFVDAALLEEASADGRRMHEIVYGFVSGGQTPDDVTLSQMRRLDLFKLWYGQFTAERALVAAEEKMEYPAPHFVGHPDMVFNDAIVDLKRRRARPRYDALQLAGYALLAEHKYKIRTKNWFILELLPEAKEARLVRVYDPHAKDLFIALVAFYHREKSLSRALQNYFKK